MKVYVLTEQDREEILRLLKQKSFSAVKNSLIQLRELKDFKEISKN